jgi:hypothetical protein
VMRIVLLRFSVKHWPVVVLLVSQYYYFED